MHWYTSRMGGSIDTRGSGFDPGRFALTALFACNWFSQSARYPLEQRVAYAELAQRLSDASVFDADAWLAVNVLRGHAFPFAPGSAVH